MKNKKLGVRLTENFAIDTNILAKNNPTSQKKVSHTLPFTLPRCSGGIIPAFLGMVVPSVVGAKAILPIAAFASVPVAQTQSEEEGVQGDKGEFGFALSSDPQLITSPASEWENPAPAANLGIQEQNFSFTSTAAPATSIEAVPETLPISNQTAQQPQEPLAPSPATEPAAIPEVPQTVPLAPGEVRILSPQPGTIGVRATNLVIQYNLNAQPTVTVNGQPINPQISTQVERDEAQNLATQVWYNIPLQEGENTLTAQVGDGTAASVQVMVAQRKTQIEIRPLGDPRVQADGRSTITLEGTITDEKGEVIREDVIVTLTSSAGKFVGADQDQDQAGFQVLAREGQFTARLQSTLEAQQVRVRAAVDAKIDREVVGARQRREATFPPASFDPFISAPLEAYTYIEFTTYLRPSLATGVINLRIGQGGTDYWGSRSEFLRPDLIDDGTTFDVYGAAFATGKVGEWLFTGAFNSDRPLNLTCEGTVRLFGGIQFCEQQYPVYGDSSTVSQTAPSIDSFFARFERTSPVPGAEPDYVMWGDYNTQEFARASQFYTATTRALHGFKGNYNFGNFQVTALYANNIEGFQRDTIQPNGTSGYYFLSRRFVIPGSENIFLEVEEINRPGTVLERKLLYRGADYEIDYDRGTILFRRPIFATELNPFGATLVRRVVITYQNEAGEDSRLYGGRLQYNFSQDVEQKSFLGGSYLLEDQGEQEFELYGADFLLSLGNSSQIIGEYARSSHNLLTGEDVSGSAYRLEAISNFSRNIQARAYYRSVEENFANNATFSYVPGQTRYGALVQAKVTESTAFQVGYDHEENFGIASAIRTEFFDLFDPQPLPTPGSRVNNELTTLRAGVVQKIGEAELGLEYVNRSREDRVSDVFDGDASQLVSRLKVPLTQSLSFLAQNELNLGDSDPLYPNRTTFGLDWQAYPGVTLRLAHQFFEGGLFEGNAITTLDTIVEHKFSEDTSITGRYSILSGVSGMTGQGAIGLNHQWAIAPGLRIRLGYEHVFRNTFDLTAVGIRFPQPYAVGQSGYTLGFFSGDVYTAGIEYTANPNFKASARFDYRNGSEGDNLVITAAAAGKISPALTALARFEQANGANIFVPSFTNSLGGIEELGNTINLRVGLAYRDPNNDKFNGLLRYEYRQNPSTIPTDLLREIGRGGTEHVFAAEGIYAPNWRWEFYGKFAMRNSTSYLSNDFSNGSTVYLSQLRTTYKLGYRTDLAVEGRWIGQPGDGFNEFGFAVESGYYVTPDLRLGLGYSFGSVDDRDFTGYRSEGGIYVNLSLKLNELFGGFGRQNPVPRQEQESQVQPVAQVEQGGSASVAPTKAVERWSSLLKRLKLTQVLK